MALLTLLLFAAPCFAAAPQPEVTVVDTITAPRHSGLYTNNRAPLAPSPFIKLPIGAITPQGWLRHMLELERQGMIGRLKEISPWLDWSKSSWADREGRGKFGWEEMPYWLKGYGDLGYVLQDKTIQAEAKKWIEAALASQREDGWFGPRELLTSLNGKTDLWPHMVMLNVLQSYYEFSGDRRVLDTMTRYMRWENQLPESAFGEGYWPKIRMGDNIESCYWLYNRTGEPFLLELTEKMHRGMARWDTDVINWHNVNIAQGFRAGTVFWMQSKEPSHLASAERNYRKVMDIYGQFPGGGFVGDEVSRPGYTDPRGGIETCGIVEFTHSFQMLMRITGNPVWIDRCEEIAFNSLPASMSADQKALHYVTCANQVQLDPQNKAPAIQNRGTMFSYSPFEVYRCCQHNVSHGWPYYAEELWLATHDAGLCASLYSSSEARAKVADGVDVLITEETDYPFSSVVNFTIHADQQVEFPLYLRIPGWCDSARITIAGKTDPAVGRPSSFLVINRAWKDGDTVRLSLPMHLAVTTWPKNSNATSVSYGHLAFSLAIEENWRPYGNRDPHWPEWEVLPASPWNYGLVIDAENPADSFQLMHAASSVEDQPWTPKAAPLKLRARGKRIPGWKMDSQDTVGKLQPSPVLSNEPVEDITLIPMGAARLRISMFPTIAAGPDAHEWVAPMFSASHCYERDSMEAVNDGLATEDGSNERVPRFTWWDHRGGQEWIQWTFPEQRLASGVEVYWFQDTDHGGGCDTPESWTVLARYGDHWQPVKAVGPFGTESGTFNQVRFEPVFCDALKIEAQLKKDKSAGILEWRVLP